MSLTDRENERKTSANKGSRCPCWREFATRASQLIQINF